MKIIIYMNYTTNTIMQLNKGFRKFLTKTEKIKFMVCKWKCSFRVENRTFLLSY